MVSVSVLLGELESIVMKTAQQGCMVVIVCSLVIVRMQPCAILFLENVNVNQDLLGTGVRNLVHLISMEIIAHTNAGA